MSDTDQLLWRAYASHVQQLLLGDGTLNHEQVVLVSPPTQRGIAAGGTIPGTVTNYLINAIADNLFPVDLPVLSSRPNPRYSDVLKSYLTWVESRGNVAEGTKLRLLAAHRDLAFAEENFRQEEDSSIGRWQKSAQDNLSFAQWTLDNAQSYIEAKQRYKTAEGAFMGAAWGYYGPDSTTLLGYIERISAAKDISSQKPGLNMPVAFAGWREIERIRSSFEASLAVYNLPAYSIQGLSSVVDEWVASFSSTEDTTISISTATGATTSWSDLGFSNISGTANVFSVTVDGSVKYLDMSDGDGDIQIDLRYKRAQVFPVTAGIWDIPHVKKLFPRLRENVPYGVRQQSVSFLALPAMADSSLKRQAEASPPHQRQLKTTRIESGGDIEMSEQGLHDINAKILESLPELIVECAQSPSFDSGHATVVLLHVLKASPNLRTEQDPAELSLELLMHPEYVEIIRSCVLSRNFDEIGTLPFIETVKPSAIELSTPPEIDDGGRLATIKSWGAPYTGSAASCLFKVITECDNFAHVDTTYSRHLSIVQSSGTGKSRMVDELSKTHLVIPVNLRKAGTNGYPPADDAARTFLLDIPTLDDPAIYYTAYLTALFEIASGVIRTIKSKLSPSSHAIEEGVAFQFRALMTELNNSSVEACFRQHGEPRTNFYGSVVARARELVRNAQQDTDAAASPDTKHELSPPDLTMAAWALVDLIKPQKDSKIYTKPLIILSFDEAHTLAEPSNRSEELFFALCRVLRRLRGLPIFTLFLSTMSINIQHFAPPVKHHSSNRVLSQRLKMFPPYMELGFDQFAEKLRDGARTIQEVSQYEYMVKFGRPLFATRYKYGSKDDRDNIIYFAISKLGGSDTAHKDLACMAMRLTLQFNATTTYAQYREKRQVSDHMRICLSVDENSENMVTITPSEPILAEAARRCMRRSGYSLPGSLLNELKTPGLKGDGGELIALVLLTLACDSASSAKHAAAFPLLDFFKHLFPAEIYADICEAMPSKERTPDERRKFGDTFRNSKIYFNHFIRVNDYKVVNRKFLSRLIARGAAVLCKDNQLGANIIIPFLYDGDRLHSQDVGGILLQIKNVRKMTKPRPHMFEAINPYGLGFFDKDEKNPVPVIRMVFSLGSSDSDVFLIGPSRRQPPRASVEDETASKKQLFTAFDIWCAGAYSDTFAVIKPDDEITYAQLLKVSETFPAAYESKVPEAVVLRQQMNPGSAWDPEHWLQFTASEELSKELSAKKGKSKQLPAKVVDEDDSESDDSDDTTD